MPAARPPARDLRARLRRVRLLLCDVDGILTDGSVFISGDGMETKRFNIHDGLGIVLARKHGLKVGWVSARPSPATAQRAAELKIDFLHQDKSPKLNAVGAILSTAGMDWDELCYMGDDVVDLAVLRRAGLAVSVPDGTAGARALAHHVTRARGGHGAVREVVELILKAQGKWATIVREYAK
ncbi:MAG: HAD-IIIA family hydrolase [Verrucomicrobia bacterium]|nr:HAD-IIIA family hydrolase [Verrucomicrobiota bacterium]